MTITPFCFIILQKEESITYLDNLKLKPQEACCLFLEEFLNYLK